MTTNDYLIQLQLDKENLKLNLEAKGVKVLDTDTFTEMSQKVNEIETGGGDLSEYFTETIGAGTSAISGYMKTIKKMPAFKNTGTNCEYMFTNYFLETLDLSKFDTSNVTSMSNMFQKCENIKTLDLSNWNTPNLLTLYYTFAHCTALKILNVSNFNTSKVTNMNYTFYNCKSLETLDLSNWNTPTLMNTRQMFDGCEKLNRLDIRNFDFTNVTSNYTNMFRNVPADCLIIVADETAKTWITEKFTNLTNVKTVAELEA